MLVATADLYIATLYINKWGAIGHFNGASLLYDDHLLCS
jgi:hypothetical protein